MGRETIREIVKALMESACYFELNLKERLALVAHVFQIMGHDPLPVAIKADRPLSR